MGGILGVTRDVHNHCRYKKRLEELGFRDAVLTAARFDGLNMIINEIKPRLVILQSSFYQCGTPYMLGLLVKVFPELNIASVSLDEYPAELAMAQIKSGAKSYVNYRDDPDEFYRGLDCIREGKAYVSDAVQERMEMRNTLPYATYGVTDRRLEVLRCLCNGFTQKEITETLHISERTVEFHKKELYIHFAVRNEKELIRVALMLGLIKLEECVFYGRDFELTPKPIKPKKREQLSISNYQLAKSKEKEGGGKNKRPAYFFPRSFTL